MTAHFVFALSLVPFGIAVCIIYKGWPYVNIHVIEIENDNRFAIRSFRRLLKGANKKMIIYDDGDKTPGSIYESEEVVSMVKEKLTRNKRFVMYCNFNLNDSTLFREKFESHNRVYIKTRKEKGEAIAHYKIIDDGKMAYLSWHREGSTNRKVKIYDFSNVRKRRWQNDVMKEYIGKYLRDAKNQFAASYSN